MYPVQHAVNSMAVAISQFTPWLSQALHEHMFMSLKDWSGQESRTAGIGACTLPGTLLTRGMRTPRGCRLEGCAHLERTRKARCRRLGFQHKPGRKRRKRCDRWQYSCTLRHSWTSLHRHTQQFFELQAAVITWKLATGY